MTPQAEPVPPATAAAVPPPPMAAPRARPAASPRSPVAGSTRSLVLNAISEQGGVPVAVVNDRVVREGDFFDGIRVLRIGAAEVEVEVDGGRRILRF